MEQQLLFSVGIIGVLGIAMMLLHGRYRIQRQADAATRLQTFLRGNTTQHEHSPVQYDPYDAQPPPAVATRERGAPLNRDVSSLSELSCRFSEGSPNAGPASLSRTVVQVGGHGKMQKDADGHVIKTVPGCEKKAYEEVQGTPLAELFVGYHGSELFTDGKAWIVRLADATAGMSQPCVMDIKMGTRTFLESETTNNELRKDLADKLCNLDPHAVSQEELDRGITKLKYMTFREQRSSSAQFGWRIEGIAVRGVSYPACKDLHEKEQLVRALQYFVEPHPPLKSVFLERLRHMRTRLDVSDWFAEHEIVGSSILFVYDGDKTNGHAAMVASANAVMIDFAKTERLPPGQRLTHRTKWKLGNREEGYLFGLDSLIDTWASVAS